MKKLIIMLICLLTLVSCSKAETNDNNEQIKPPLVEDKLEELQVKETNINLNCGEKIKLPTYNVKVSYSLLNNDFAKIKDGYIYGLKEGTVKMKLIPENKDIKEKEVNLNINKGAINEITDFNTELVYSVGRNEIVRNKLQLNQSASSFRVSFYGSSLKLNLNSLEMAFGTPEYSYLLDNETDQNKNIISFKGQKEIIIDNLEFGYHEFKLLKRNEAKFTRLTVNSISTDGYFTYNNDDKLKIEVFGDSITCGYAIYGEPYNNHNTNALDSYAYLTAKNLDAEISVFASSGMGLIKGETLDNVLNKYIYYHQTSTNKWDFNKYIPDIVIINLGTNDLWHGVNKDNFVSSYVRLLNGLREEYKNTKFVCVGGMMTKDINNEIERAVNTFNDNAYFIDLNQANGSRHPILSEHILASETLTNFIKSIVK